MRHCAEFQGRNFSNLGNWNSTKKPLEIGQSRHEKGLIKRGATQLKVVVDLIDCLDWTKCLRPTPEVREHVK